MQQTHSLRWARQVWFVFSQVPRKTAEVALCWTKLTSGRTRDFAIVPSRLARSKKSSPRKVLAHLATRRTLLLRQSDLALQSQTLWLMLDPGACRAASWSLWARHPSRQSASLKPVAPIYPTLVWLSLRPFFSCFFLFLLLLIMEEMHVFWALTLV